MSSWEKEAESAGIFKTNRRNPGPESPDKAYKQGYKGLSQAERLIMPVISLMSEKPFS